jgi:hypothetical protein
MVIQEVLRVWIQALSLIMVVRVLFGRLRRRGMVPETETRTPETKRLAGWEWLLLVVARSLATSILVEALQLPRRPRRPPPSDASLGERKEAAPDRR